MASGDPGSVNPTASSEQRAEVGRALITISLAWGTLGLAVPFGSSTGPFVFEITPLEVFISLLALVGAIGLVLDFFHPWRSYLWRVGFAEMMVGFLWSAASVYELIVPGPTTIEWRLGHSLMYGGYAILSLTTWRWINKGNTRGRA
jgi:hypothetical protein